MRRLIAVLAVFFCAACIARANEAPDGLGAKILPSLVKVISVCGQNNESRVATGFVWGPDHQVVTDMHVVVGCQPPFTVLYFVPDGKTFAQVSREATIGRVLRAADLVLLSVSDPPNAPPLPLASQPVVPEQWVEAWGFPLGIQAPVNTRLQVTFANDLFPQLSSTLDDTARSQLAALHFPDLSSEVLHLSGPLQPGDSGAPVLDAAGDVVGIGSGGLQQGAASVSWAMRSHYLDALLTSADTLPPPGDATSLFAYASQSRPAAGTPPAGTPGLVCGQLGLSYRGDAKLAQLAAADSNAEIEQLARDYGVGMADVAAFPFRIWIEAKSGAAIVVPSEAKLQAGNTFCRADADQAAVSLLLRLEPLPADPATPEWALAVSRSRWQALGLFSRAVKSRLIWRPRQADWQRQSVINGALVHRGVMDGRDGLEVFRADLDGREVSISEGAAVQTPPDQMSLQARVSLVRVLAAVALTTFPPPDQTQPSDVQTPPADEESTQELSPSTGPKLYTVLHCGTPLLLMSPVPRFATLVASPLAQKTVVSVLQDLAKVSPDSIRDAQYDVWAQASSGITALVPRGTQVQELADGGACLFVSPDKPELRVALIGRKALPLSQAPEFLGNALRQSLQLTSDAFQPLAAQPAQSSVPPHIERWRSTATDAAGRSYNVAAVGQAQSGFTLLSVVAAPDSFGARAPAPRLGAALAGLLLTPAPPDLPTSPP